MRDLGGTIGWHSVKLGAAYALAGRVADSLPLLDQADLHAQSRGGGASRWLVDLSEANLRAGRPAAARDLAARALALARECGARGHQAWALRLVAEIAARHEPPDVDEVEEAHYREAQGLAEELGMRPLQAHCHLGLGKLCRRVGRLEEARAELSTALSMLREMGMTFWLPEAEAELKKADTSLPVERGGCRSTGP